MKICPNYKVRKVAGEIFIVIQGKTCTDLTRVISLNDTSLLLWNSLQQKDFSVDDAVGVLLDNFDVVESVARQDAEAWVRSLRDNGLLVAE